MTTAPSISFGHGLASYQPRFFRDVPTVQSYKQPYLIPVSLDPIAEVISLLESFKEVPANWDGYGAKVPLALTINNAIRVLRLLAPRYQQALQPADIALTPYGTVTLDWRFGEECFLSLEVGKTRVGFFSETTDGSNPKEESIPLRADELVSKIQGGLRQVLSI